MQRIMKSLLPCAAVAYPVECVLLCLQLHLLHYSIYFRSVYGRGQDSYAEWDYIFGVVDENAAAMLLVNAKFFALVIDPSFFTDPTIECVAKGVGLGGWDPHPYTTYTSACWRSAGEQLSV